MRESSLLATIGANAGLKPRFAPKTTVRAGHAGKPAVPHVHQARGRPGQAVRHARGAHGPSSPFAFSLFRTKVLNACYAYRVERGPFFVPGLPHAVAHSRRPLLWALGTNRAADDHDAAKPVATPSTRLLDPVVASALAGQGSNLTQFLGARAAAASCLLSPMQFESSSSNLQLA